MREAAQKLAGGCAVAQVNTEESPGVASRFKISGIPTVILLRGERVVDTISGALDSSALVAWCTSRLSRAEGRIH